MPPPIDRILRERSPVREFQDSVESLEASNPRRAKVLFSICSRLEFVERLRHALKLRIHGPHTSVQRAEYEIDRLATYLTLTCLDIAAAEEFSGSEFHDFPDWASQQFKAATLSAPFAALIHSLAATSDSAVVQEILVNSLTSIKEAYFQEEGVTRHFKRLITLAAPPWLQLWLSQVYAVEKNCTFSTAVRLSSLTWHALVNTDKLRRVADYLFYLRNQYTHTVDYIPPNEKRYAFHSDGEPKDRFSVRYIGESASNEDKLDWFVALRADLAESDVIRLIVVQRLRAWLGIIDDDRLIDAYLQRVRYRHLAYLFIDELERNHNLLTEWSLYPVRGFLLSLSKLSRVLLGDAAGHAYVTHHRNNYPERDVSQCSFDHYFSHIDALNAKLNEFNQHTPPEPADWHQLCRDQIPLFQQLLSLHEAHDLLWCIENMERDILSLLETPWY